MYARLGNDVEDTVVINKITNVFETTILTENDGSIYQGEYTKENVIKASYNIIDILEVGDYVNGFPVIHKENDILKCGLLVQFKENEIKSVITHEQMEQMAYKVGE